MKTIILTAVLALFSMAVNAQKVTEKDVPPTVKTAFKKLYPTASDVKWEKENGKFEAEFKSGKTEQSALFDTNGQLVETEVEIPVNTLPAAVHEYMKAHYPGQPIKEAEKITDVKGTVTYEVEIKGSDLLFDAAGKFIKEEKETKDKE